MMIVHRSIVQFKWSRGRVQVFHGSDSDVEWLQRDFGVYIVNMFDTFQAASLLNFEHRSLAVLLSHYCHITVDKQYQRADWRIR